MAKNDTVLLDGIIDQRILDGDASGDRGEVFELFVLEQILKNYDLSQEEIESGWIDGKHDGGIDGFYIFINGIFLEDAEDFVWPKSNAAIELYIISCKHHDKFAQATLDAILATIQEFFDLSLDSKQLQGSYSEELLECRTLFSQAYRRLSIGRPVLSFSFIYASRGDNKELGESVQARAHQINVLITTLFSSCSSHFAFIGASELVSLTRQVKSFSLDLPFVEHLATGRDSYVLLTKLSSYWKFVCDENGNLRRYLFDSNVRDYLGASQVNQDIAASLSDDSGPDFWWLNNGVTILATSATVPGKTIQLKDIQIVNGLQTTETIYHHFKTGSILSKDRCLLVKIIVSSDPASRDRIIRATNNQSLVDLAALHATDKIQRDIESILEANNWYYERRRNYYRYVGKPSVRFVTPLYMASASVCLVLKNPGRATRLKAKFMRIQASYDDVFSTSIPIAIWPVLANIYKQTDAWLASFSTKHNGGERFLSSWRPLLAFVVVARNFGTYSYKISDLLKLNAWHIEDEMFAGCWELIANKLQGGFKNRRASSIVVKRVCETASISFGLTGIQEIARRDISMSQPGVERKKHDLTPEFIETVDKLLPPQPWKPGLHIRIAEIIQCKPTEVTAAIQALIADNRRNRQTDGVVYGTNGEVIATDPERQHSDS